MTRKRGGRMSGWAKFQLTLLALAVALVAAQFIAKRFFDVDLGITFFGLEMF